jgi:hypothetical protein
VRDKRFVPAIGKSELQKKSCLKAEDMYYDAALKDSLRCPPFIAIWCGPLIPGETHT